MPRLLRAQQIARAANFEVAHCNLEARAELGVLADGFESLFCDFGQNLSPPERQIGVSMAARPSHAAAQLVQLGKAELIRVFNDEGVHVRNVDTGLNDRRADQNLNLSVGHCLHHVRQLLLIHLSVRYRNGHITEPLLELRRALVDRFDPVVEIIHLPAAGQLPADRLVQDPVAVLEDEGLHRVPVVRRLLDG